MKNRDRISSAPNRRWSPLPVGDSDSEHTRLGYQVRRLGCGGPLGPLALPGVGICGRSRARTITRARAHRGYTLGVAGSLPGDGVLPDSPLARER